MRFLAFLVITGCAMSVTGEKRELPNIVIILTDDQGYADVSYNPHHPPEVSTPHMDALARESVIMSIISVIVPLGVILKTFAEPPVT